MTKETLFFTHATGFQSPMYHSFLKGFEESFDVQSIPRLGQNQRYPLNENWANLVLEVIDFLEGQKKPVVALGHSMGGLLNFLAAVKRPDLFKLVVLLDSPVLMGRSAFVFRLSKWVGLSDHMTPAKKSKKRKSSWDNKNEAWQYLKNNGLFKRFSPESLKAYFDYGIKEDASGRASLSLPVEEEVGLFRTTPHHLDFLCPKKLPPLLYVQANKRVVTNQHSIDRFVQKFKGTKMSIEGGHLFPLETPESSSGEVLSMINKVCL